MRINNLSKTITLVLVGGFLSVVLFVFLAIQALPMLGYAQQAPVLQVACVPSNNQISTGEAVSFNAQVLTSTQGTVSYAWQGESIQTINSPQITTSYTTPGIKYATTTVASGDLTAQATCAVEVTASVTPSNFQVTCAPSKSEVARDEPVVWRARVTGATGNIAYRWSGVNITSRNEPAINTSYGSIGTKRATVTVVSGGKTTDATCSLEVKGTVVASNTSTSQQNQNPGGSFGNILQSLLGGGGSQGGNPFGGTGLPTGGGQTGGLTGGSPLPTGTSGGPVGSSGNVTQQTDPGQEVDEDSPALRPYGTPQDPKQQNSGGNDECSDEKLKSNASAHQGPQGLYAVPTDTVSINDYIWSLIIKEVGAPEQGQLFAHASLDAIANCANDVMGRTVTEGTGRWLTTGFDGKNPVYIENFFRLYTDIKRMQFELFIDEYKKNKQQQGGAQGGSDIVLTNLIGFENNPKLHETEIPKADQKQGWESFLVGLEPAGQNTLRYLSAQSEIQSRQDSTLGIVETETLVDRGVYSEKDRETGEIITPGSFAGDEARAARNLPIDRLSNADEAMETIAPLLKELQNRPGMLGEGETQGRLPSIEDRLFLTSGALRDASGALIPGQIIQTGR